MTNKKLHQRLSYIRVTLLVAVALGAVAIYKLYDTRGAAAAVASSGSWGQRYPASVAGGKNEKASDDGDSGVRAQLSGAQNGWPPLPVGQGSGSPSSSSDSTGQAKSAISLGELTDQLKKLLDQPQSAEAKRYFNSLSYFSDSPEGQLARYWLTMGLFLDSSPDIAKIMNGLSESIQDHSFEIMKELNDHSQEIHAEPFTEQASMSLVNGLQVSLKDKTEFFGAVLDQEFKIDGNGNIPLSSANITTALIYLKQINANPSEVLAQVQRMLDRNRQNSQAYQEVLTRSETYFPGLLKRQ
jgi:hypothetical protein